MNNKTIYTIVWQSKNKVSCGTVGSFDDEDKAREHMIKVQQSDRTNSKLLLFNVEYWIQESVLYEE